ncbi:MAG: DUF420 domain-containing protein [Acidobacteria bacterium]|nr:DUF420 domain-containing protein [Acidobacteriota bacterium]MCI0720218.1 DUF420 domain-containing protein [Acidobacteriota bacterium]
MISVSDLPALNATLNATSTVLLALGFYFVRRRELAAHKRCMLGAFAASTLFLTSYLAYHFQVPPGSVRFAGTGWLRGLYYVILLTHITLAAAILPLALITLSRALKQRFDKHRRIARWTLPLWLYVSVTGVVIYWMLYRL